ncbi:MAG: c-type cytochrome [Pseudomonadota bacterium]
MPHSRIHIPVLIALGFALASCGAAETVTDPTAPEATATTEPLRGAELLARGEAMVETLCAQCHAVRRDGDSPHREAIPLRQISWNYPVQDLAEPFAEGIMVGHPDMPQWQFEPMDIEALLAYIESIQEPRGT